MVDAEQRKDTTISMSVERDTAEGWMDNPSYIPKATVKSWLVEHYASLSEFIEDNGDRESYRSDKVFEWLGY